MNYDLILKRRNDSHQSRQMLGGPTNGLPLFSHKILSNNINQWM